MPVPQPKEVEQAFFLVLRQIFLHRDLHQWCLSVSETQGLLLSQKAYKGIYQLLS